MMAAHTPTPWELVEATEHHGPYVVGPYGDVADLYAMSNPLAHSVRNGGDSYPVPFTDADANAAFIVKAVNLHDELVDAVRSFLADYDGFDDFQLDRRVDEPMFRKIKAARFILTKAEA